MWKSVSFIFIENSYVMYMNVFIFVNNPSRNDDTKNQIPINTFLWTTFISGVYII